MAGTADLPDLLHLGLEILLASLAAIGRSDQKGGNGQPVNRSLLLRQLQTGYLGGPGRWTSPDGEPPPME